MGLKRLTHKRPEVTPEASVMETVQIMAAAEIGAIAVKEGPTIVGVFTERDLMRRVVAQGRNPATTPIREVMTTDLVTVHDSAPVFAAAAAMRSRRMRHLVVLDDDGGYAGILAQRHVLYDLMNELSMKVDDLAGYLMTDGPGG
jgi:CBS domain-containing protein